MAFDKDKIAEALKQLDPTNDDHWTADGLPRLDAVKDLSDGESISRQELSEFAPDVTRTNVQAALEGNSDALGTPANPTQPDPSVTGDVGDSTNPKADGSDPAVPGQETRETPAAADQDAGVEKQQDIEPADLSEEEQAVEDARAELDARREDLNKAQAAFEKAQQKVDEALDALAYQTPGQSTTEHIQQYLQSQQRERDRRARLAQDLNENGLNSPAIRRAMNPKSPLDQAMSRKNTRGTSRPVVNPGSSE